MVRAVRFAATLEFRAFGEEEHAEARAIPGRLAGERIDDREEEGEGDLALARVDRRAAPPPPGEEGERDMNRGGEAGGEGRAQERVGAVVKVAFAHLRLERGVEHARQILDTWHRIGHEFEPPAGELEAGLGENEVVAGEVVEGVEGAEAGEEARRVLVGEGEEHDVGVKTAPEFPVAQKALVGSVTGHAEVERLGRSGGERLQSARPGMFLGHVVAVGERIAETGDPERPGALLERDLPRAAQTGGIRPIDVPGLVHSRSEVFPGRPARRGVVPQVVIPRHRGIHLVGDELRVVRGEEVEREGAPDVPPEKEAGGRLEGQEGEKEEGEQPRRGHGPEILLKR